MTGVQQVINTLVPVQLSLAGVTLITIGRFSADLRGDTLYLQPKHIPALDGVRGIAIFGVLVAHSFTNKIAYVGVFGVDLFFVLSGFLITRGLLQTIDSPHYMRNFYGRRFLRLFPVYYAYLAIAAFAVPAIHRAIAISMQDYGGSWWWYLLYSANWKPNFAASDPQLGHLWSLAVEEQFYLIWPAVVLFSRRRLPAVCVCIILGALAIRTDWALHGVAWNQLYRLTITRIDAMAFGALAAKSETDAPIGYLFTAIAGLCVLVQSAGGFEWTHPQISTVGATLIAFISTYAVLYAFRASQSFLCWGPLAKLGRYSYFIYVFHELVISHVRWGTEFILRRYALALGRFPHDLANFTLSTLVVFIAASLSWRWFESPLLSLKKYL